MTFRENLLKIEEKYGIKASYIAERAGLDRTVGSRLKNKLSPDPRIKTVTRMIKACPVPWEWEIDGLVITNGEPEMREEKNNED